MKYRDRILGQVYVKSACSTNKALPSALENEIVTTVTIRACRLLHGSVSWLATGIANTLSFGISPPIEHWWVILRTH